MIATSSQSDSSETAGESVDQKSGGLRLIVLNEVLFFGVKIGNTLRGLGYQVEFAKTTAEFAEKLEDGEKTPALGIVDINAGVDWTLVSALTSGDAGGAPILAFGSHLDVDGLRAAKAAGARRVVSNGDFHRDMVKLAQRYARAGPAGKRSGADAAAETSS